MMTFNAWMENLWGEIPVGGRKPSDGQPDGSGPNPNHGGSGGNSGGGGGMSGGGGGAASSPPPSGGGSSTDPLGKSPLGMMKKKMKKR